jgi:hypothetical protein
MFSTFQQRSIGRARIMSDEYTSDGTTALLIQGFRMDEKGVLDSTFRLMPLIPTEYSGGKADQPLAFLGVLAMGYMEMYGEVPELFFVTMDGVFRYAPWLRGLGGFNPALEEVYYYDVDGAPATILPQDTPRYPPSMVWMNNRMYVTFCDGGGAWVLDGLRGRPLGFTQVPAPPLCSGPAPGEVADAPNAGGFSVRGRIGTTDSTFINVAGESVGGIDNGNWRYGWVWENTDGAYSATSELSGVASIQFALADPDSGETPERLRRRLYVHSLAKGPPGTAAGILLRTANQMRLPDGDTGAPHFLHRIANNLTQEYIDDFPDGELGPIWEDRMTMPLGVYFIQAFGGSLFFLRTDGYPARVWWSEQTAYGPIPESIMAGHWTDVFPETGPVTASCGARGGGGDSAPILLVFKENAAHYLYGQYPVWQAGTLHAAAGCAGPGCVRACPDGSVVWYGSRTFWRMNPDGTVEDIGGSKNIRRWLRRVNSIECHNGTSWVDRIAGEVVFVLPTDDDVVPTTQFVYDYISKGFRLRYDVKIHANCVITSQDIVLVAGEYDSIETVWVYGRGYPGWVPTETPEAWYVTGWSSFSEVGPSLNNLWNARDLIVTMEERSEGHAVLDAYQDWDPETKINVETLMLAHPENDAWSVYGPWASRLAVYGEDVWRYRRFFPERKAMDVASCQVAAFAIHGTLPMAIVNIDLFGPPVAMPGGRTPQEGL